MSRSCAVAIPAAIRTKRIVLAVTVTVLITVRHRTNLARIARGESL